MTCNHCWMDVCADRYAHCTVYVEVCPACGVSRKITVWLDGETDVVYSEAVA